MSTETQCVLPISQLELKATLLQRVHRDSRCFFIAMEFMPIKIILCILWMYNTVFKVLCLARAQEYVEDDPVF